MLLVKKFVAWGYKKCKQAKAYYTFFITGLRHLARGWCWEKGLSFENGLLEKYFREISSHFLKKKLINIKWRVNHSIHLQNLDVKVECQMKCWNEHKNSKLRTSQTLNLPNFSKIELQTLHHILKPNFELF